MVLRIPEFALVVLIGPSGAGKSSFARKHFRPSEILSSDYCRYLVADDENDQQATRDAFEVVHFILARRLRAGKLTVVDATNVQQEARRPLLELARQYHCAAVAIVLNLPRYACAERNHSRPDRDFPPHVLRSQAQNLRRSLGLLASEGFHNVYFLNSPEEIHSATVQREPLACNRSFEHGPFDIIGDVHGCFEELAELLKRLGYQIGPDWQVKPPENRKAIFLGDLVDGGPNPMAVLRLVMGMVRDGFALCVPGDGDVALLRQIRDGDADAVHTLSVLLTELAREPGLRARVACLLEGLPSHYVLDGGKLVVAHAGMKEEMQGRESAAVRAFALSGETNGDADELGASGHSVWAADYRGSAMVVYGHTAVCELRWIHRTVNINTAFGGRLTALRYPEREFVSVPCVRNTQTSAGC
ncbi:MAG TPA: AAA family ATPase [Bryobacteraceae bacterium]|nr:AAA family ATPase [Bryobacteraceae bacterium]